MLWGRRQQQEQQNGDLSLLSLSTTVSSVTSMDTVPQPVPLHEHLASSAYFCWQRSKGVGAGSMHHACAGVPGVAACL
jgi:hypothetical protein